MQCEAGEGRAVLLIGEEKPLAWLAGAFEREGYGVRVQRADWTEGWQRTLQRAREACCALRARYGAVYVLGQSGGAALALMLAQQYPLKGAVCLSAPLALKPFAWMARESALFPVGLSLRRRRELLGMFRRAREKLYGVECPLMAVQSLDDPCLSRRAAGRLLRECPAEEKQLLRLYESGHLVSVGSERALLLSAILAFLRANS